MIDVQLKAPNSFYDLVPWVPRRLALPTLAGVLFVINMGVTIAMLALAVFGIDHFTYWDWLLVTVWLLGITLLFPVQGWPITLWAQWVTPLVVGSTALTTLLIWVIIAIDDRVYVGGTAADPAAHTVKYTFSQIRTADWIVHGLPLLEVLLVYLFDFQLYFRAIIFHWERSAAWTARWWYWLWVYVGPLLLLLLYMAVFDPREKYTKKLTLAQGFGIAVALDLLVMTLFTLSVRLHEHTSVLIGDFYPSVLHQRVKPS